MALNKALLELLVCPKCKGKLSVVGDEQGFLCEACAVVYPIKNEIPIMIISSAIPKDEFVEKI